MPALQAGNSDLPAYLQGGAGLGSGFNPQMFGSGLAGLFGGLFGDSGAPYEDASNVMNQYMGKSEDALNPYINAGKGAIGNYQDWLSRMKDPTAFINSTMNQYQQSPWSRYLQNQSLRSAQAAASASGLSGSTPMMQQIQQNASNISSGDMNQWLQNVLGVNTEYGQGNQYLMGQGANAANSLANMYNNYGQMQAQNAYGESAGDQNDLWNTIGGIADIAGSIF